MTSKESIDHSSNTNQNTIFNESQNILFSVKKWLEANSSGLLAQKNIGEFNGTIMQWFHWYSSNDGKHWVWLESEASNLAGIGITAVWLPPAYKGMNGKNDTGYSTYDLFDLGEFDQKGSIRTKYGTKDEYLSAIKECRANGIEVYADAVFNHKMGGDFEEEFEAVPLDEYNRHHALGPAQQIRSWTGFNFPGRGEKYSKMRWNWNHFDSVDCNTLNSSYPAVWQVKDKPLEAEVDGERGNYDFLMGCDLDLDHPEVTATIDTVKTRIEKLMNAQKPEYSPDYFHKKIGSILWTTCGMARDKDSLEAAIKDINDIKKTNSFHTSSLSFNHKSDIFIKFSNGSND